MKAERDIQTRVLAVLLAHPFVRKAWRNRESGSRRGRTKMNPARVGSPDLEGFLRDGRFLGVEVKTPDTGWGVQPQQAQWGQDMRDAGAVWFVAHSPADVCMVLAMREEGKSWEAVDTALEQATGKSSGGAACAPPAVTVRAGSRGKPKRSKPTAGAKASPPPSAKSAPAGKPRPPRKRSAKRSTKGSRS